MDLNGSAVPWPGVIRAHSTPGLSSCIEERRLYSDGRPLASSALEAEALRLAEWAFATGGPLVLVPPDPLAPLSALIAAAVHVADMTAYYRASGNALGSSRRVAVVTGDYHARGVYRGLGVRNARSSSVASLLDVVPAAALGRDGVVRVLASDPRTGWSTIFAPTVAALASVPDVDSVVVSMPVPDAGEALSLGVPVVIVAADPSDRFLMDAAHRSPVFGWGVADIVRASHGGELPPRLACRAAGSDCEAVAVEAHTVCENAALFWQDIGPLARSGARSGVARELAGEAFSLFHDLAGLALPIRDYEDLTAPLRVRLDAVTAATRLTKGDARDLYLPMVEAELRGLAEGLGDVPPKREALLRTLEEAVRTHRDVMLVARTAELARLHRVDLAGQGRLASVRVTSLGALPDEAPADVAVLTGMAPSWARWVYRSGIARSILVLAYTPEKEIESVARGFDEVEIVRTTVALQSVRESWLARPSVKDRVWSELSGDPRTVPDDCVAPPWGDASTVSMRTAPAPDVPPNLWAGEGWFSGVGTGGGSAVEVVWERRGRPACAVVEAVRVRFDDGRWTLMDVTGTVTRFRPGSTRPEQGASVSLLSPGDRVLVFDGDSRKDLLAKVIEVAVEVPALAVAGAWVAHWRRVLGAAYRKFGTYNAFADALRAEGCTVQTQTVRLWVIGVTIGPEDDEDVRRVGVVMDDVALRDNHWEVCRGVHSLRGAHVRLGQRLAAMATHFGSAAASGLLDADEVVDQRSGLTVADFRESVEILTVGRIEPAGGVPYVLVGRMNEESDSEEGTT